MWKKWRRGSGKTDWTYPNFLKVLFTRHVCKFVRRKGKGDRNGGPDDLREEKFR